MSEQIYAPPLPQHLLPNDPRAPIWGPDAAGFGVPYPHKGPVPDEEPTPPGLPGSRHGSTPT